MLMARPVVFYSNANWDRTFEKTWHAWPSPRTAAAVEKGLEAEGAESHLSETLGFRAE